MIIETKLMKYIIFKKRTEQEVRKKMQDMHYEENYIEEAIAYLKETQYINDEQYIVRYIENCRRLKHCSVMEIRYDLRKRGIADDLIERYLSEELYDFEVESAKILAAKKYKNETDFEKIRRYLAGKGYQRNSIAKAIDNLEKVEDNGIGNFRL